MEDAEGGRVGLGLLSLLVLGLAGLAGRIQSGSPVLPLDAGPARFSAARAMVALRGLVGDGTPRVLGSPADARGRDFIVGELGRLGYRPEVQRTYACGPHGTCGAVENVLARRVGREPDSILLVAHRDSARVSPGASDDGYGVAALLELARLLASEPEGRYPVELLFADGEESGLLGAAGYVADHPSARQVGLVINLDGRGTRGAGVLYQTSKGNAWILKRFARGNPRPVVSSAFATIYDLMPLDTDLSVFLAAGFQGVNFAYVADTFGYHTPLDKVERAHPPTLQHQGDNALALLRRVQALGLEPPSRSDAVAFDLFSRVVVCWPARLMPGLALLALVLVGIWIGVLIRRDRASWSEVSVGLLTVPWCLAVAGLVAAAVGAEIPSWFVAADPWRPLAAPAGALAALLVLGGLAARRGLGRHALAAGVWLAWALAGLVLAVLLPGISYLVVVPAGLAALVALAVLAAGREQSRVGLDLMLGLPPLGVAVLWVPVLRVAWDGLGFALVVVVPLLVAAASTPALPLALAAHRARPRGAWALAATAALTSLLLVRVTPFATASDPQRLSLELHRDADRGAVRWLVPAFFGPLPEGMRNALPFSALPVLPFPWSRRFQAAWEAPAAAQMLPAPLVDPLGPPPTGAGRTVELLLRSPRGGWQVGLAFAPGSRVGEVTLQGCRAPATGTRGFEWGGGWQSYSAVNPPPEGVVFRVRIPGERPVQAIAYDAGPIPDGPEYRRLAGARPPTASLSHQGDVAWVTRRVEP